MTERLKVMTVIGTRPEIIRLSETIKLLDEHCEQIIVHTGQNYDYELNEVFFEDLGLRRPDVFLEADTSSLGAVLGSILLKTEAAILKHAPDAMLVLGDTNSAISAVMAKRMKVPVFHMEAGNRSFDENVPEETNRRLVDHVADYNLVYTEHARRNLLAEGIHPSRVLLTGSPMREVLDANRAAVSASDVLRRAEVAPGRYILVSLHREENVDEPSRLTAAVAALEALAVEHDVDVLVSTHPRTRKRLEASGLDTSPRIRMHAPFGFHDYLQLQCNAMVVLSDSGTISEESILLGFPAVTLRDQIERPEALDVGGIITAGVHLASIREGIAFAVGAREPATVPAEYAVSDTSRRVVASILSNTRTHHRRAGIRQS
ncbi:MAG: UDP-N-acetylglucosamine 2-epimerase (non-hydrolyzing) [Microcella sp.]|uniref:non-hydrolyzing UDP-N-acetylglucosamine 2-epimerase n=1 Tax=Microcella sp. TaxID=1913979 RepID=UPI00272692F1|nr:UDP-N-acetylglucosamine 2-epimerase (non-hydrolyzing) [Microcella sp.]MDO8337991.1 UDP-N-acetylglucosamine 2-epimerase (non-hydrolyzing) [Microcella sp.]